MTLSMMQLVLTQQGSGWAVCLATLVSRAEATAVVLGHGRQM